MALSVFPVNLVIFINTTHWWRKTVLCCSGIGQVFQSYSILEDQCACRHSYFSTLLWAGLQTPQHCISASALFLTSTPVIIPSHCKVLHPRSKKYSSLHLQQREDWNEWSRRGTSTVYFYHSFQVLPSKLLPPSMHSETHAPTKLRLLYSKMNPREPLDSREDQALGTQNWAATKSCKQNRLTKEQSFAFQAVQGYTAFTTPATLKLHYWNTLLSIARYHNPVQYQEKVPKIKHATLSRLH